MTEPVVCREEVVVDLNEGLHFAPCQAISLAAARFSCDVEIHKDDLKVDAKSMLDLLTLLAECGQKLVIEARGEDAEEALAAIRHLFHTRFQPPEAQAPQTGDAA